MYIEELLLEFGDSLGLAKLGLDKYGVCRITYNKTISIDIEPVPAKNYVHIRSVIGRLPAVNREHFYEIIFQKMFFGKETGQASICVDKRTEKLYLWQTFEPEHQDVTGFTQLMENFLFLVKKLKDTFDLSEWQHTPYNDADRSEDDINLLLMRV